MMLRVLSQLLFGSLLVAGCGGGQPSDTRTIGAKVLTIVEVDHASIKEPRKLEETDPPSSAQTPSAESEEVVEEEAEAAQELDSRFRDAAEQYAKSSWSTWELGERMGGCLTTNAASMTSESREAVIEHGRDEAFDKLSGVHLMSLRAAWDICASESEAASAAPSPENATVIIISTQAPSARSANTSTQIHAQASTEAPNATPTPPPKFMVLPFTKEHEPLGIMPMGETINHPPPNSPWGHPGIDFQWDNKPPIVAVSEGEVVELLSSVHVETGIFNYSVSIITGEFIVNYTTLESVGADIKVGSQVVSGEVIGYPTPVQQGHQWHMIHWEFGTYEKHEPTTNPEGIVSEYETNRLCPVPYFTDSERQRLVRIWGTASYGEKDEFPDLCNGAWKNYDLD